MIIYIAGEITGLPERLYKQKFADAEQMLKDEGHTVLNPTVLPPNMPQEKYLPICLAMLSQADAIFTLDNWVDSNGAKIEKAFADYQGKIWYNL